MTPIICSKQRETMSVPIILIAFLIISSECLLVERTKRSNSQQLYKRNVMSAESPKTKREEDRKCGFGSADVLEVEPQEMNEKAESIQGVWVGRDVILIIASDKVQNGHSTIWRGTLKPSIGIFTFKPDTKVISEPVKADTLQVSPAGNRATVLVVSLNIRYIYVSRDYGQTWDKYNSPTVDFDPVDELYMSHFNPRHIVIRSNSGKLWISDNSGERWNLITKNVQLVEFSGNDLEYVYYSTASKSHNFNPLYRLDIGTRHTSIIDNSAYRFRVDSHYLFVSRKNFTGRKEDEKSRRLYVTDDYLSENVKFQEAQLPSLQDEQFYAVMATHETGAFIHVYQGNNDVSGSLYVSDSTGSRFTLSLSNHLYHVYENTFMKKHYTVHDFYEVESMRGVYVTTVVDPELKGHVTKITFDNGGIWTTLTPPTGTCSSSPCSLHLHLRYSQVVSPFYNMSSPEGPLSIKSAPMIIVAHGSIGQVRSVKNTRLYLTNDGGYTWKDVGLPVGSYVYGIADYGNIIAVAPNADHVEKIWFSHDRGTCFVERMVDTTGVFQLSRGLFFDPSAASLWGFLMGVEGTGEEDEWRVITLNFISLLKRTCNSFIAQSFQLCLYFFITGQSKDYVLVEETNNCLMGYRRSYNLTKSTSICYNKDGYNYHSVKNTTCPCSFSDYECDYGFSRSSLHNCTRDSEFSLSDMCPPGTTTYQQGNGFRLIPGDTCSSTAESEKILSLDTLPCTDHEKNSGFRVHKGSTGLTIFVVILIALVSIVAATISFYLVIKCRSKELMHTRVYYRRLPGKENGRFSTDSSDEDMITAT